MEQAPSSGNIQWLLLNHIPTKTRALVRMASVSRKPCLVGYKDGRCSICCKGCRRVTHRPRATESMWQGALPGWLSVLSHHPCLKWLLDKWKGQELGPLFSLSGKKHRALPFLTARGPSEPVWSEGAAAPPKAYLSLRK